MENKQTLNLDKIFQWFKEGEKKRDDWLIGTEHEKFLFKKNDFKRLGYEDLNGIKAILNRISEEEDWKKINEGKNLTILNKKNFVKSSLLIGPEGGFSVEENEMLKTFKFVFPISFGKTILRSDTAAIVGLSYLNIINSSYKIN